MQPQGRTWLVHLVFSSCSPAPVLPPCSQFALQCISYASAIRGPAATAFKGSEWLVTASSPERSLPLSLSCSCAPATLISTYLHRPTYAVALSSLCGSPPRPIWCQYSPLPVSERLVTGCQLCQSLTWLYSPKHSPPLSLSCSRALTTHTCLTM